LLTLAAQSLEGVVGKFRLAQFVPHEELAHEVHLHLRRDHPVELTLKLAGRAIEVQELALTVVASHRARCVARVQNRLSPTAPCQQAIHD